MKTIQAREIAHVLRELIKENRQVTETAEALVRDLMHGVLVVPPRMFLVHGTSMSRGITNLWTNQGDFVIILRKDQRSRVENRGQACRRKKTE